MHSRPRHGRKPSFIRIAWIGLLLILFVALRMIWEGWHEVTMAMEMAA
ncbi:hypothetical protein [Paracoccus solventivorans]|nr:hypothetical protein [Paracoccus solventivorans]